MKMRDSIKDYVSKVIDANRFAVLATECDGQPHASLVAITPTEDYLKLIFATYRDTRKYANLTGNGKVAILFENRSATNIIEPEITVLTAFGQAVEVNLSQSDVDMLAHLSRHPELVTFLLSSDCAIFSVKVEAYQAVRGIDDVIWWKTDDLEIIG